MAWYDLSASNQAIQNAIENRSRQQELFDQRAQYISNAFQQGGAGLQTLANTPNDIKQQKQADALTNHLNKALGIDPNAKATKDKAGVSPLESFANKTPQVDTSIQPSSYITNELNKIMNTPAPTTPMEYISQTKQQAQDALSNPLGLKTALNLFNKG